MMCSGEIHNYEIDELAVLLECSPRTIRSYISSFVRTPLAKVTPDDIPITLKNGKRMLIMIEQEVYKDCEECEFYELCKFLLSRDCYVACERPLEKEM